MRYGLIACFTAKETMSKILIGKYEATIYPEGDGYTGAIDVGYDGAGRRQRIKRKGRTKAIVKGLGPLTGPGRYRAQPRRSR